MDEENQIEVEHTDWSNYNPGDHETIKKIIKNNINTVCANYIANGYYLNYINEQKLYKEDGYSGIGEYAEAEYGIKKDKCSYLMKIAKKFCIPNSPALLPEYRKFKIEKLREMVYLNDEQLEQVTLTTTRAEIRDMKKPVPEKVAPAQLEPEKPLPLSAAGKPKKVYSEGSALSTPGCEGDYSCFSCGRNCQIRQEGRYCVDASLGNPFTCNTMNVHENLRTDIGDKCMFVNLDLARIRSGDKEPVPCCKECTEKCGYECNRSAHGVNNESNTSPYDDKKPDIGVTIYNVGGNGKVEKFEVVSKYSSFSEKYFAVKDKSGNIHNLSSESEHWHYSREDAKKDSWYREKTSVTSEIVNSNPESEVIEAEVIQGDGLVLDCYNDEEGWHKEIIQSSPDPEGEYEEREMGDSVPDPESYGISDVKVEIRTHTEDLIILREENVIAPARYKTKMRLDAATVLLDKLSEPAAEAVPEVIQPELPILKNNDQRKDWAENYKAWGEWYYDENIDCHYYKYDFQNGDRLIVEEYRDREAYWGNDKRNYNYFHLLQKEKLKYEKNKTYEKKYEHDTTSMTEIVEYLKDIQKKGL